jgi:hypothetical protein
VPGPHSYYEILSGTETKKYQLITSNNVFTQSSQPSLTIPVNLRLHALSLIALEMKRLMHILSLALLAITGVTAEGPVRAYHPSLFAGFRESSNRCHRYAAS